MSSVPTEHSHSDDCAVCDRQAAQDPGSATWTHRDHHRHLEGTTVYCSCGEFFGVATVAITEDYDPDKLTCGICGQRGVIDLPLS